jgi:hypothetical protein
LTLIAAPRLRALAALAVMAIALPTAAQAALPPFSFDDVDFTRDCRPNAAFGRLLGVMTPSAPADDSEWRFDEPVYNAVAGHASHVLSLDREVGWHGLRLVEVRFFHGIERGPANFTLAFAESPEQVRAVWNARGWNLPPAGETREIEGLDGYASIGVEADGALAAVTCFRD